WAHDGLAEGDRVEHLAASAGCGVGAGGRVVGVLLVPPGAVLSSLAPFRLGLGEGSGDGLVDLRVGDRKAGGTQRVDGATDLPPFDLPVAGVRQIPRAAADVATEPEPGLSQDGAGVVAT